MNHFRKIIKPNKSFFFPLPFYCIPQMPPHIATTNKHNFIVLVLFFSGRSLSLCVHKSGFKTHLPSNSPPVCMKQQKDAFNSPICAPIQVEMRTFRLCFQSLRLIRSVSSTQDAYVGQLIIITAIRELPCRNVHLYYFFPANYAYTRLYYKYL